MKTIKVTIEMPDGWRLPFVHWLRKHDTICSLSKAMIDDSKNLLIKHNSDGTEFVFDYISKMNT